MQRNTFQRGLVLDAIHTLMHPTAEQVYADIIKKYPSISKATVYRNLAQLVQGGIIRQIHAPQGADHFDYMTRPHYHFHCQHCQSVFDVDLPYNEKLNQLARTADFDIQNHRLIFTGICEKCRNLTKKGKKHV
ncbi:MAG: transcriptional repressor [Alphaproteobacteria bacterium]